MLHETVPGKSKYGHFVEYLTIVRFENKYCRPFSDFHLSIFTLIKGKGNRYFLFHIPYLVCTYLNITPKGFCANCNIHTGIIILKWICSKAIVGYISLIHLYWYPSAETNDIMVGFYTYFYNYFFHLKQFGDKIKKTTKDILQNI
jgi:hypothetical protein